MEPESLARRVLSHLQEMDREATSLTPKGNSTGLYDFGRHFSQTNRHEESWSAALADRLTREGISCEIERRYPGTGQRCDLVVDLDLQTRIWIEVKGSWHSYWGRMGSLSKATSWIRVQLVKDAAKLKTLDRNRAAWIGLLLVEFDDPDKWPGDGDIETAAREAELSASRWNRLEDRWDDPVPGKNSVLLIIQRLPLGCLCDGCPQPGWIFRLLVAFLRSLLLPRSALLLENVALRHQLTELQRSAKRAG